MENLVIPVSSIAYLHKTVKLYWGAFCYSEVIDNHPTVLCMKPDNLTNAISGRRMPSHQWAKQNTKNLGAIAEVAEAEYQLAEAIKAKAECGKYSADKEAVDNQFQTAMFNLASTYLEHGAARGNKSALLMAMKAKNEITHSLYHESVTTSR